MFFYIIILAFISFITIKFYQKIRVPEGLKNVPTISFLLHANSMLAHDGPDKRWNKLRGALDKEGIGKLWFNGEWHIITNDLELAKEMFTKPDLYPKTLLGDAYPGSLMNQYYDTNVVFSNGDVWKRHRRITNPAFKSLPIHIFNETAMKLLKVMEKIDNEPIEVKSLMHRLTLDVLGKASFGFDFNNLEDPTNVYVTTYNEVVEELNNPLYFLIPSLKYIPYFGRTEAIKKIAELNDLYLGIIEKKRRLMKTEELTKKIDNNTADLLEYMVNASSHPDNPTMTDEEIRANLAMFMFAGHDTTATSLAIILYLLSTHKDVQKKVRDEIIRVLGDEITPSIEQQKELKYMNMVINENLRLYPPIHQLPPRITAQEIKFRDHVFPAKTNINLTVYGIHHTSKYWENPEEFIPERFENELSEKRDHYTWLSFGGGARSCLGNNFSLIEQRVMLCSLLRKYEISLPADSIHKDKIQLRRANGITTGLHPIHLIFKRRTE